MSIKQETGESRSHDTQHVFPTLVSFSKMKCGVLGLEHLLGSWAVRVPISLRVTAM